MICVFGISSSRVERMFGPIHEGGVLRASISMISCTTVVSHCRSLPFFFIMCGVNFCREQLEINSEIADVVVKLN